MNMLMDKGWKALGGRHKYELFEKARQDLLWQSELDFTILMLKSYAFPVLSNDVET